MMNRLANYLSCTRNNDAVLPSAEREASHIASRRTQLAFEPVRPTRQNRGEDNRDSGLTRNQLPEAPVGRLSPQCAYYARRVLALLAAGLNDQSPRSQEAALERLGDEVFNGPVPIAPATVAAPQAVSARETRAIPREDTARALAAGPQSRAALPAEVRLGPPLTAREVMAALGLVEAPEAVTAPREVSATPVAEDQQLRVPRATLPRGVQVAPAVAPVVAPDAAAAVREVVAPVTEATRRGVAPPAIIDAERAARHAARRAARHAAQGTDDTGAANAEQRLRAQLAARPTQNQVIPVAAAPTGPAVEQTVVAPVDQAARLESAAPASVEAERAATPEPVVTNDAKAASPTPASPFSQMNVDQRIETLLAAVDHLVELAAPYDANFLDVMTAEIGGTNTARGRRHLTANTSLTFAMEIALEHRRAQVPDIARRMIRILPADVTTIQLFGVDFPRERIEEWSREESLPEPIPVREEYLNKDNGFGQRGGEDVHNINVRQVGTQQLNVMRSRTAPQSIKTAEQTDAEIRQYINAHPSPGLALLAIDRIMRRNEDGSFNQNLATTMTTIWGYIDQCSNAEMKQNLLDSMITKFAELAEEYPCNPGVLQRLVDIPSAIDLSLPQDIPEEEVFRELAQIAGNVNEAFEENYEFDCKRARAAAGDDETTPDRIVVDDMIANLKREMFLAKARVELVLLRNIDSNFVMTVAERVFPEGSRL